MGSLTQQRLWVLLALVTAAALCGGGLFWHQRFQAAQRDAKSEAEKVLGFTDPAHVTAIELVTPKGLLRLSRANEVWRVVAPLATKAEDTTVVALLTHLSELKASRSFPAANGDLSVYGLLPPRFRVALTLEGGTTEGLLVGKKASFDGSIYVRAEGKDQLSLVPGELEFQVDKGLYDLRDKKVLDFDTAQVKRLIVEPAAPYRAYNVQIDKGVYMLGGEVRADGAQVDGILSALANLRASEFVREAGESVALSDYAVEAPAALVRVELDSGQSQTVRFGKKTTGEKTEYFARRDGDEPVCRIAGDWVLGKLLVDVDTLRDKAIFHFEREQVQGLRLVRDGTSLEFARAGTADWKMTQPEPHEVKQSKLNGLLYTLWDLKADKIWTESAEDHALKEAGLFLPVTFVELLDSKREVLARLDLGLSREHQQYAKAAASTRIDLIDARILQDIAFEKEAYWPEAAASGSGAN